MHGASNSIRSTTAHDTVASVPQYPYRYPAMFQAMTDLIKAGRIRYWGLSNETAYGVTMMCETAKRLGVPLPITIQNDFSLCDRCSPPASLS